MRMVISVTEQMRELRALSTVLTNPSPYGRKLGLACLSVSTRILCEMRSLRGSYHGVHQCWNQTLTCNTVSFWNAHDYTKIFVVKWQWHKINGKSKYARFIINAGESFNCIKFWIFPAPDATKQSLHMSALILSNWLHSVFDKGLLIFAREEVSRKYCETVVNKRSKSNIAWSSLH